LLDLLLLVRVQRSAWAPARVGTGLVGGIDQEQRGSLQGVPLGMLLACGLPREL